MNFGEYVDDLAKRGIIDGHIAEMLCGKHREEVAAPFKPVRDAISPILTEMWNDAPKPVMYANRIDDELSKLEGGEK